MKKVILLLVVIFLSLILSGCIVLSLHPYYTAENLYFEPGLEGNWKESDESDELWTFEKSGENGYRVIITTEEKSETFEVKMFSINDMMFLDALPERFPKEFDYLNSHSIRVHSLYQLDYKDNSFEIRSMDYGWLKENLKNSKLGIDHEIIDKRIILTASTEELQAFIVQNIETLFEDEAGILHRIK
jgi:hypothetical protein